MRHLLLGPYTLRAARRATAVALFFQWFIIIAGATVRLTGSGLGCPNWPTCTDTRAVPEASFHPLVEFINRMASTPTLLAALVAAWVCWRLIGGTRADLRIATSLTILGVLVQAGVGAFTVILELPPQIVAVHFLVSIVLLTTATFAWHAAGSTTRVRLAHGAGLRVPAAIVMLVMLLVVIVAGVLTTASGPHSGASGTGQVVDRFDVLQLAVMLHARGAFVFLALVLVLSWLRHARRIAMRDLGALAAIVTVQIAIGEIQYRNGLPWAIVLAHVATAGAIWVLATRIAVDATFPASLDTVPANAARLESAHDDDRSHRDRPAGAGSHAR